MKPALAGTVIAVLLIGPVAEAERSPLGGLFACLDKSDAAGRALCLETEARQLRDAERSREVVVMDRAQVTELRRRVEKRPAMPKEERQAFVPVDAPLTGVQLVGGRWLFTTATNGDWIQAEMTDLGRTPRTGDRFRVRRGVIGGFLANVGTGPAIRVRSVQ